MKRGIIAVGGCLGVWVIFLMLALIGNEHGGLEITSPRWATLVGIGILLLPAVSLFWCVATFRGWVRISLIGIILPIALISGYFSVGVFLWNRNEIMTDTDTDSDIHLLHMLKMDGPTVRAYMISPMLSGNSIVIQQERPLVPGLIWKTSLYSEDNARKDGIKDPYDVNLAIVDKRHIRCTFLFSGSDHPSRTVTLRTVGW